MPRCVPYGAHDAAPDAHAVYNIILMLAGLAGRLPTSTNKRRQLPVRPIAPPDITEHKLKSSSIIPVIRLHAQTLAKLLCMPSDPHDVLMR